MDVDVFVKCLMLIQDQTMENTINLLDVVALTADLPEYNLWRG
jgi:hypothetical protein